MRYPKIDNPVLLLDGDLMLYKAVYRNGTQWDINEATVYHIDEALTELKELIEDLMEFAGSKRSIILLSGKENFRKALYPEYKANRKEKPPEITEAFARIRELPFEIRVEPKLEADDLMGLLHTGEFKDRSIIVTGDKDLRCVPGVHINPYRFVPLGDSVTDDWFLDPVSPAEAAWFHRYQTLVGDSTDNIKGCPKIGDKKAKAILEADDTWDAVLSAYEAKGLGIDEMLFNARLTFILRDGWFNFETKEVKLWEL